MITIDFTKLINPHYLLDPQPKPDSQFTRASLIFFGLLLAAGVGLYYLIARRYPRDHPYQNFRGRVLNFSLTCGIIGLVLMFFRFEAVWYLSSRILMVILGLVMLGWFGWLIWWRLKIFPSNILTWQEKKRLEKYLPRSKSRK